VQQLQILHVSRLFPSGPVHGKCASLLNFVQCLRNNTPAEGLSVDNKCCVSSSDYLQQDKDISGIDTLK
jgi:hypothetical protein